MSIYGSYMSFYVKTCEKLCFYDEKIGVFSLFRGYFYV